LSAKSANNANLKLQVDIEFILGYTWIKSNTK